MSEPRMSARRMARGYALSALYHADHGERQASEAFDAYFSMLKDERSWLEESAQLLLREVLDEMPTSILEELGLLGDDAPSAGQESFARRLVEGVAEFQDDIDALIEEASTNWRVRRMPVVDRNILRMATFELMKCDDIPANVSVNEAIELAKRFGGDDSRAFVNGLVDRIGHKLGRLKRSPRRRSRGQ